MSFIKNLLQNTGRGLKVLRRFQAASMPAQRPIARSIQQAQIQKITQPTTSGSTNAMLNLLGMGTLTGTAAYTLHEHTEIQRLIREISTYKPTNLDDLHAMHKQMLEILLAGQENKDISMLSAAINEAVTHGNKKLFAIYLNDLMTLHAVNDEYLALLINTCAAQGKASLLSILDVEFHLNDLIEESPYAKALLNNPLVTEIERLAGQFISGVGNIKDDGAHVQLAHQKAQDKQAAMDNVDDPPVTGLDPIDDAGILLSFLREQDNSVKQVDEAYKSVVILDMFGEGDESFKNYLKTLKKAYDQQEKPINSIFLLYGGHFTSGQIKIDKKENGEYDIQLFYIDSNGGASGDHPGYFLAQDCETLFPKQVEYIVAETKVQHAPKGCSVFSLMNVYDLIHMEKTLAAHAAAGLKEYKDIFDYLKDHVTGELQSVGIKESGDEFDWTFVTALPPAALSRGKQTMSHSGEIIRYPRGAGEPTTITAIGYMGLPHEIANSDDDRKKEVDLIVNHNITETLQEWFDKYIRKNAQGKPQNLTTQLLIGQWGMQIAPWLANTPPKEIKQYTQAFLLKEFARKNLSDSGDPTNEGNPKVCP